MIELLYKVEILFDDTSGKVKRGLSVWLKEQPTNLNFVVTNSTAGNCIHVSCLCKVLPQAREWDTRIRNKINSLGGEILPDEDDDEEGL